MTADRLATPEDLASLLERDDVDAYKAGVLVECATAVVQAAVRQRIVQVISDTLTIMGTSDSWLPLPEIPVTAVASVTLDGQTLTLGTDYKVFGNRLWGRYGWQVNLGWPWGEDWRPAYAHSFGEPWTGQEPSAVVVVCDHGYPPGSQKLQLGRSAVLSICKGAYGNPGGLSAESIDDYSVTYAALTQQLDASAPLVAALRRQYGRRAGLVRVT